MLAKVTFILPSDEKLLVVSKFLEWEKTWRAEEESLKKVSWFSKMRTKQIIIHKKNIFVKLSASSVSTKCWLINANDGKIYKRNRHKVYIEKGIKWIWMQKVIYMQILKFKFRLRKRFCFFIFDV